MLRSVCFNNFVKFKNYQILDFSHGGPFIFIGENGSGKSSVLEGIRRCLKEELSTSASSSPNANELSYFICKFDGDAVAEEHVICGIVVKPDEDIDSESETDESVSDLGTDNLFGGTETPCQETTDEEQGESHETDDLAKEKKSVHPTARLKNNTRERDGENLFTKLVYRMIRPMTSIASWFMWFMSFFYNPKTDKKVVKTYYKFAMKKSGPMHVNLMRVIQSNEGESCIETINLNDITDDDFPEKRQSFVNAVIKQKRTDEDIKKYLRGVFDSKQIEKTNKKQEKHLNDCKTLLEALSNEIVFTFPLRSIGPLQWSESTRIHQDQRKNNYSEAEKRCEILKYYLEDLEYGGTKFHEDTEQDIFKTITQCDDYIFELKDGQITLPKGKYALLKTPEGILEAKFFSILMSGKKYRTIILEEPDRGMHPQFIERMMQVMNEYRNDKRVILTTHNSSLITPWSLPNCFVFKRRDDDCRICSGRTIVGAPTKDNFHMKKLRLVASDHVSDILFAKKVLFFEGDSELLFLTEFRRQVLADELSGVEIFKDNKRFYNQLKKSLLEVTLVKMNGKGNAAFCHNVCKDTLELGHLIIVDRDAIKVEEETEKEEKRGEEEEDETKEVGETEEVGETQEVEETEEEEEEKETKEEEETEEKEEHKDNETDGDFNLHQNAGLELHKKAEQSSHEKDQDKHVWAVKRKEQLKKNNIFFWLHGDIEDMVIKMTFTSEGLLEKLKEQNVSLDVNQYQKKKERHQKLFLRKPVTVSNIKEGTKLICENCTADHDLYRLITYLGQDNWDTISN